VKVLVVDDEVEVVEFLSNFLRRFGFEVEKAINGKSAVETFSRFKPDWILLDLKMPDIDGFEVLRRVKEISPAIQAIMITGKSDEPSESEALTLGIKDYLVKPVDLTELSSKIKKHILKNEYPGS
jgi:DNA-binding response OmpR family regulator